ncbi:MAG: hypothetical protein GY929_27095, partial [Actinomycetia bacterium]|nr:hypothetical protein [Actinomycetes bacterium]
MISSALGLTPVAARPHLVAGSERERGVSLPDVLIGLAIVGVLMMAAMRALIVIVDVGAEGDRSADRRQDVERVADFVLVDVAGAERVADDLAPGDY